MRRGTVFYKMSGSGNDFILFDGRYTRLDEMTPVCIRELCDRRHGVGADGAILLDPGTAGEGAHFMFHFYNLDGSQGPMCGNGALCATRLATLIELAPAGGEVRFSTQSGLHTGRVLDGRAQIHLPDTTIPRPLPGAATDTAVGETQAWLVHPSVPHLVVPARDVAQLDLSVRGPVLRGDRAIGEGGANVNWVCETDDGFRMRTFERGVEGETLACGTGAVACALTLEQLGKAQSPVRIWTRSGMPLDIAWNRSGEHVSGITLTGEARVVYRGIVGELPSHFTEEA